MIATIFDWIFIKVADNRDRHKILDKLDFSMVWTIGMIVLALECPIDLENVVLMTATSF